MAVGVGPVLGAQPGEPSPGVSLALARHRRAAISELRYQVSFTVPEDRAQAVTGAVTIRFRLARAERVILDFRAPAENVGATRVNGRSVRPVITADHVTIPGAATTAGENTIEIQFTATDAALNRRDDYFYALFVPDRASTAFPCFDQPDLKARFQVTLLIPEPWDAVANGAVVARDSSGPVHTVTFRETAPISTYLISFAAGRLATEEAVRDGRRFTMYHRETDSAKVARNRDAIFDLHAASLAWLERYTGIPYPFEKFDFFAIPAFQFGGMEHPGAVWYNASGLFLDQSATRNQHLGRASVIAHETAHMWFGDLVTMEWFNDVWMKEVFANFMAAKIVGPEFADINHDLRFYLAHQPSAHQVDRTAGANPIRQPLENLREAGSLYGAIIYQKAPVVMRQLERTIGEAAMERGLREYLDRHRFGNATWTDLIAVLDRLAPADLRAWSRVWVESSGRPTIALEYHALSRRLHITQTDSRGRGFLWPQTIAVTAGGPDGPVTVTARLDARRATVPLPFAPRYLLGGTDGVGYGRFTTDRSLRPALMAAVPDFADPVARSVGWQTLAEELIDGTLDPTELLDAAGAALRRETDDLISQQLLGLIQLTYWRYLTPETRSSRAEALEAALLERLEQADRPGRKGAFFNALVNVTITPNGLDRLERIWRRTDTLAGLPLEEPQYTTLAETLALKRPERAEAILDEQLGRIQDPDRRARFRFVRRALSPRAAIRDSAFASFGDLSGRRRESWVLDAMRYLNHPLRAAEAIRYLRPSLELVEEIKRTGDIFFPLNWLSATLDGHRSAEAAAIVARFLADHPRYPPRLKGKVEQAADGLFRAARAADRWRPGADR